MNLNDQIKTLEEQLQTLKGFMQLRILFKRGVTGKNYFGYREFTDF